MQNIMIDNVALFIRCVSFCDAKAHPMTYLPYCLRVEGVLQNINISKA